MDSPQSWTVAVVCCMVIAFSTRHVRAQPPGYFPQPGTETACLNFAIDFFNRHSGRPMRSGPVSVASAQMEVLINGEVQPTELWYRFMEVLLMDTPCPNTADNNGASPYICPVMTDMEMDGSMPWNTTCSFKVWNAPSLRRMNDRFRMIYMHCY